MNAILTIKNANNRVASWLTNLQSIILLSGRIYIAWVFFKAGLTTGNQRYCCLNMSMKYRLFRMN